MNNLTMIKIMRKQYECLMWNERNQLNGIELNYVADISISKT